MSQEKYQYDHAEKLKTRKEKKSEISIKKARANTVEAKCRWGHPNYNPCDVQEVTSSRIPSEVKRWIEERFSSWSLDMLLRATDY